MKNLSLFLLFLLPTTLLAQKAKNYTSVTDDLTGKIIATVPSGKSLHVAVVPFMATAASSEKGTAFGEYITETIIGSLTGTPDKIKVFERTRLDAILKEQEFILTDLMKPAAALKIGQLVPIDALLSGTYTKLKSYIDVNARLIDVATGEISVSFNGRIKMTKNLATLFTTNNNENANVIVINSDEKKQVPSPAPITEEELCRARSNAFTTRLQDLTSPEKISEVVAEAKKIPFNRPCGRVHYEIIYAFTRYKIDNGEYKTFLLQTLDTIAYPSGDDRATEIARFLVSDGQVDEKEWSTCFHAMTRISDYRLRIFNELLLAAPTSPGQPVMESRIANYFNLASAGKMGLPRPVSYETAFFHMLDGLKKNEPLRRHVYGTYAGKLTTDDRSKPLLFSSLHSMYKEETNLKPEVMKWIIDFVNTNDYPKAHEQLYDFSYELDRSQPADANLQQLIDGCRDKYAKFAVQTEYQSQKEDRITFCLIHQIPVPGIIPTLDEADVILKGNNAAEQQRVTSMLVLMGDRPKKLENSLAGLFAKRSLDDREKLAAAQTNAIIVLGNIKTTNTKAVEYMIGVLPHYGNDTEAAEKSLAQIGKPAVGALVARLDKTTAQDGGLQFQLVSILGKIGKDAASAEKSITRVLNGTSNSDIKYAAEAALQEIKK